MTPEKLEEWVRDGWVDLRLANCARWIERFQKIHAEIEAIPEGDTSSRYLRNRRFWHKVDEIQPGKVVGWILGTEEGGYADQAVGRNVFVFFVSLLVLYSRRCRATGMACLTLATRSRSISARARPGPSEAVAIGIPQGSTIMACPQVWARPPSSCRPCWAGAMT